MCRIDHGEMISVLSEGQRRAKKAHKCGECGRTIEPGETYESVSGIYDGSFDTYKTCLQCCSVRKWLANVCAGWVYSEVLEEIEEHFYEGYGMWLGRAAVSMRRKWRKFDGSLMLPMDLPDQLIKTPV